MSKIILTNLGMVLTEKCNFSCKHCMRGHSNNKNMDIETMVNTFDKVDVINNLTICGGEPLIDYELFYTFIKRLLASGVIIGQYSFVTNGTFYTEEVDNLLKKLDEYVHQFDSCFKKKKRDIPGTIELSWDNYHQEQLKKIAKTNYSLYQQYIENIKRLVHSAYFQYTRDIDVVFNTGNAKNLEDASKIDIRYMPQYYFKKNNHLYHGPLLGILTDGTISECDGEFDYLRQNYNYGNINYDNLEEIILKKSIKKHTIRSFNYSCERAYQKFLTYK